MRILLLFAVLMGQLGLGQTAPAKQAKPEDAPVVVSIEVVPIDKELAHKLVFENEYVRVFSVEVAPHAETKYHQHDRDYVWVSLGDSDVESVRVGATAVSVKPKDGETQFTKGGFAHKAVNKSDKPFRNVTVELKGKRYPAIPCNNQLRNCTTVFRVEGQPVGSEQKLFSWNTDEALYGSVTREDAEVTRTFLSVHGQSRVLLIPLTYLDLRTESGIKHLGVGDSMWLSGNPDLSVLGKGKPRWVVLKFWGPEDTKK